MMLVNIMTEHDHEAAETASAQDTFEDTLLLLLDADWPLQEFNLIMHCLMM